MNKNERDSDYIAHILAAINKIERYLAEIKEAEFYESELLQDAVIRNLEIIGEAVSKLSSDLKSQNPDTPWRQISGMRNRLVHAYMNVNLEIVWNTIEIVLPLFKQQMESIQEIDS